MHLTRYGLAGLLVLSSACTTLTSNKSVSTAGHEAFQNEDAEVGASLNPASPVPAFIPVSQLAPRTKSRDAAQAGGKEISPPLLQPAPRIEAKNVAQAKVEEISPPSPPQDLWGHLAEKFTLLRASPRDEVLRAIERYVQNPRQLAQIFENATPYLGYVVEAVEQQGLPLEIALVPMVESHYKPFVYSPRHAAGLWQFMSYTGKRYGLKQNWWYDGRRDVGASTEAALKYFQDLYVHTGDWLKALAAYNCGEGRLQQAEKQNIKAGKTTEFWSLSLPRETERHVPKILALAMIIRDAERYNIALPKLEKDSRLRRVALDGRIDLELAAKLAGVPAARLKRLNPGFKRWTVGPGGPFHLLLPVAHADRFLSRIKNSNAAQRMPTGDSVREYKVRSGDNLWELAQRYNTSVALLCQVNNLSRRSSLRVGQRLMIPSHSIMVASRRQGQSSRTTGGQRKTSTQVVHHHIRQGDTLWELARKYGSTVKAIRRLNGLNRRSVLKVGATLRIPGRASQET